MERQIMKRYIETYKIEMERAVHHPILERDLGVVNLDTAKIFFLLLPKLNGEIWTEAANTAAVAVGAVHAGFDAHDTIIDVSETTSVLQQLTVLSGDYFSGIHYRLLASIPDFDFIRALSHVIGEINETKTEFQEHSPLGPTQLLDAVRLIEAGCIIQFLHTFGFSKYVPLVASALPLLSLGQNGGPANLGWEVRDADVEEVALALRAVIQDTTDEADFIAPFLRQEILAMTIPLLKKPI